MSNYIKKPAVYEAVESMPSIIVNDKYVFINNDVYVKTGVTEPPWISTKDRLPEDDSEVIVSVYDDSYDNVYEYTCVAWYFKGSWIHNNEIISCVDAWMPLPKPYKGEEE